MVEEIEADVGDICKILLATDIHLGFNEKDPIRGEDSFNTFDEILEIGHRNEVDFILLGGDLFHDAKPSPYCLHRCLSSLRKYCLGERPIQIEFLSDQKKVFGHCNFPVVNYEDPNLNVSMPVFSIHGNHDDPTGNTMTCSLDILSTSGLVNYFGKWLDLTQVEIYPMVLRKGCTTVAIYGLSHIKDARLCRLFADNKVTMFRHEDSQDWYNLFVLHQNRAERGPKNFLPEHALPDFLDLVLWGHEHDCRIEPEQNAQKRFYVTQPGSPVATSLSEGESLPKKVAILSVYKKNFKLEPIELNTVRPFIFDTIHLSEEELDLNSESLSNEVEMLAEDRVKKLINDAKNLETGHPQQPVLPLIRLRIFYRSEQEMFNLIRFGQKFESHVANPSEIILMRKERSDVKEKRDVLDTTAMQEILRPLTTPWDVRVERYVEKYFQETDNKKCLMDVLSVAGLNESVTCFVDKQDKDAIEEIARYQAAKISEHLLRQNVDDDNIEEQIELFKRMLKDKAEKETEEVRSHLHGPNRTLAGNVALMEKDLLADHSIEDFGDGNIAPAPVGVSSAVDDPPAVRGRGRGRGSRGPRAARAPRAARGGSSTGGRSSRGGGGTTQQTLLNSFNSQSLQNASTSRSAANRSRIRFGDSDSD